MIHFPRFIRLPAPRRRNRTPSGKVRRCARRGHDWCYNMMVCKYCHYSPIPVNGSLSASRSPLKLRRPRCAS